MGQISQNEDEEDRRQDARHSGILALCCSDDQKPRFRRSGLSKTQNCEKLFEQPSSDFSQERTTELLRRAAERERWQSAWRKEQSLLRLDDLNVILNKDERTVRPIRANEPMRWLPAGWTIATS
jgi:hypothetical protein